MATETASPPSEPATIEASTSPVRSPALAPKLAQPGRSRRRGMLAFMIITVVVGAVTAGYLVKHSSVQDEVVGMSRDVQWGQSITAADLKMVDVLPDQGLTTVSWGDRDQLIGHKAATKLLAGTIPSDRSVTGQDILGSGQALVGLLLKPGQLPATLLQPRDRVTLIRTTSTPGVVTDSSAQTAGNITAQVFAVGPVDASGSRTIDVILSSDQAAATANDAAAGHIALALLPGS